MSLPDFSMRQLLEAGVHFGHQTHRWNPKMESFIFGARNGVHIIDLAQTVPLLHQALVAARDVVADGGRLLFVGTKRAASEPIADAAKRSAQYYINHRWLGGTLTNWKTISNSIRHLRNLEETLAQDNQPFTKKELLGLTRERDKLEQTLGGIKDMSGLPDLMFVIDTNKEAIAIQEARKLGIPVVAVLDSNCNPEGIDYPIPGNDDAGRAVALYCDLMAWAALEGISKSQASAGVDVGEAEEPVAEEALKGGGAADDRPTRETADAADDDDAKRGSSKYVTRSAIEGEGKEALYQIKVNEKEVGYTRRQDGRDFGFFVEYPGNETSPTAIDGTSLFKRMSDLEAAIAKKLPVDATDEQIADFVGELRSQSEATTAGTANGESEEAPVVESASGEDEEAPAFEFKGLDAPDGEPDDLKKISGVGPALEKKLNDMGIYHYRQIAAFGPEDIAAVDGRLKSKGRVERDGWLKQAAELADG